MTIQIRTVAPKFWKKVENKGKKGKFNCDFCGNRLWMGPGNTKYCNEWGADHDQE